MAAGPVSVYSLFPFCIASRERALMGRLLHAGRDWKSLEFVRRALPAPS